MIANMVRTFELETNYLDEEDPWKGVLAATAFAVQSTYHTTLKKTPGQLVFGRDMIFNIQHVANWELIRQYKQNCINKITRLRMPNGRHTPIRMVTLSCSNEAQKTNMRHLIRGCSAYLRLMITVQSAS